jgi:hypothetical protein
VKSKQKPTKTPPKSQHTTSKQTKSQEKAKKQKHIKTADREQNTNAKLNDENK